MKPIIRTPLPACALLALLVVFLPDPVPAGGLRAGFGLSAGLSIPASGAFKRLLLLPNQGFERTGNGDLVLSDTFNYESGNFTLHFGQTGPQFGAELFLGGDQLEFGLGAGLSIRNSSMEPLIWPSDTEAVGPVERRIFTTYLDMRYRAAPVPGPSLYAGIGLGIYNLREKSQGFTFHETTPDLHLILGMESGRVGAIHPFAEMKLAFMDINDHSPANLDYRYRENKLLVALSLSIGVRFGSR